MHGFPGGPGTVGADLKLLSIQISGYATELVRQLSQRLAEHFDRGFHGVSSSVSRAQLHSEDFAGTVLCLGVDLNQGCVEVDDQRIACRGQLGWIPRHGGRPDFGAQPAGHGSNPQEKATGVP